MDPLQFARTALDVVSGLLAPTASATGRVTPRKLEELDLDDLRREKVRLEVEERKLVARLRELEGDKRQLFEEGVRNASEREQRLLARKIKELDVESRNLDRNLGFISQQLRILNGFVQLKDNQRLLSQTGLANLISNVDLQTLQVYVDSASVDGEFHLDKFTEILRALESAHGASTAVGQDDDVLEIVRAMQQAREAADPVSPTDERYAAVDSRLATRSGESPAIG